MKFITWIFLILILSSCALSRDYVTIDCKPQSCSVKIDEAENVNVVVNVNDTRNDKEKVGCKKNGYGMEMASIIVKNDVAAALSQAISTELQNRGFNIMEGEYVIEVELCKFGNDFKVGFWSSTASSETIINVTIKDRHGNIRYTRIVMGLGEEGACLLNSGKNASLALQRSLENVVHKIFEDPNFINSLLFSDQP